MSMSLGINVGGVVAFDTSHFFTDMAKYFRPWKPLVGSTLALTSDGYPLANATTSTVCGGFPAGVYTLRFSGTGVPSVSLRGSSLGTVVKGDDGISRANLTLAGTSQTLNLTMTGINPADPITFLQIIEPGYNPENPPTFNPTVIKRLKPFACTRYMTWSGVNTGAAANWSDRVLKTNWLQTGGIGTAYEYIIELANEVGRDIWINIPDQATDDYVTQMASLFYSGLNSNINVYLEYANETWNNTAAVGTYARILAQANADPTITATSDANKNAQWQARRLVQSAAIWRSVWGSGASRIRPVIQGQSNQTSASFANAGINFLIALGYTPANELYGINIGPYVNINSADDVPGITLDGVFASMTANLNASVIPGIQAHKTAADAAGIKLLAYEGGQVIAGLRSGHIINAPIKMAAQSDPRMAAQHDALFDAWNSAGGDLFCFFCQCSLYDQNGTYGAVPTQMTPGSVKQDGLFRRVLPDGDVNLDGQVNYDDFLAMQPNIGQPAMFREQGKITTSNVSGPILADWLNVKATVTDMTGSWKSGVDLGDAGWLAAKAGADPSGSWMDGVDLSGGGTVDTGDLDLLLSVATLSDAERSTIEAAKAAIS